MSLVGLQVVSLSPFVPGHDEEVVLLGADSGERVGRDAQPVLVAARRGAVVDGGTARPASGVVPPHHHRREPFPGAVEELHGRFGCRLVVEHPVPSERLECRVQLPAHDGHESHRGVETERLRSLAARRHPPRFDPAQVEIGEPGSLHLGSPDLAGAEEVRDQSRPVDEHERSAVDGDVARILERPQEVPDVGAIVLLTEFLAHEHMTRLGVPAPGPFLVGPTECEREVRHPGSQHFFERPLEQPAAVEPVVVVDEAVHAVLLGQFGLCDPHLGHPQVVVAELSRELGLIVAGKQRAGLGHVVPLGEALAPPFVVLGDGVVLGKIEGQGLRLPRRRSAVPPGVHADQDTIPATRVAQVRRGPGPRRSR